MFKTKEIKKVKKEEKVCTNKKGKDTRRRNCERFCKRECGLHMNSKVLKEIKEYLNWKEKILVQIFPKTFVRIYKKGIEKGFNSRI